MSMIVAEVSSSIGLLSSVGGEETLNWGKLILSSETELDDIISTKKSQIKVKNIETKETKVTSEDNKFSKKEVKKEIHENNKMNNNTSTSKNKNKSNKNKDEQQTEVRVMSIVV